LDNNSRIIQLLTSLASSPMPSPGFETPENEFERHQQEKHKALLELARLQTVSELSGSSRGLVLNRVSKYAAVLLSALLRAQGEEAARTNHEKFLREAADYDPFLDGGVNLTRDSYAGLGEVEPDTWSQSVHLQRRR